MGVLKKKLKCFSLIRQPTIPKQITTLKLNYIMSYGICRHGRSCIQWGCAFTHPDGRIVGKDCSHNNKCWGNCDYHHQDPKKNSERHVMKIKTALATQPDNKKKKKFFSQTIPCKWGDACRYGDECLFSHEPPPPAYKPTPAPRPPTPVAPKKKYPKQSKCGQCKQLGHNRRTCWMNSLPAPPPEFLD